MMTQLPHKYGKIERERRFLLDQFPSDANMVQIRRIIDRYIDGTVCGYGSRSTAMALSYLSSPRKFQRPPFGIDIFQDALKGLILAEVEFESAQDADALTLPSFIGREVSTDNRFTGGQLVRASPGDIEKVMSRAAHQLEALSRGGGQVLFGTDVGYTQQFDTSEEFTWMSRTGMSFRSALRLRNSQRTHRERTGCRSCGPKSIVYSRKRIGNFPLIAGS